MKDTERPAPPEAAAAPPQYRPLERFWPYVELPEQVTDEELASLAPTRGGCGQYERSGYQSRLLSGPLDLKLPDDDKIINRFAIEQHSQSETVPAQVTLKIGAASHAVDPMADGGRCVIRWDELDDRQLACLSDVDTDTHDEEGTRPNDELEWALWHMGRFLYFDILIKNEDTVPADMGGAVCFSRFTFDAVANPRS